MHLGEMKFKKKSGKDDQAQPDGTEAGANVAKLLGKSNAFHDILIVSCVFVDNSIGKRIC